MADETLVINLKIDATQSAKTIAELTKRNKELAKVIKDAPREGTEGYKKLNKELKTAQNEFAKNREEIQKFNRELRETSVADDSLKGLSRQLRTLEKEYKELGKAAREDAFGRRLQRNIKSTRNQLKKLEGDLGDARRNVGNYGKQWQKVGSRIAGVGRATGAALAVTVAVEGLQLLDETITKFDELRNSVQNFSGASGEALDQFVSQTEGIAQTFDVEAEEIGKAAANLSSNLGTSFEESLSLIEQGFLAGADNSGEFLSSIESLSAGAAEAGVSSEQFISILTEGAKEGVEVNKELVESLSDVETDLSSLVDTSSEYTRQQQAQLQANKAFAASQNELSKNLSSGAANFKVLGTNIATFGIDFFNELIETMKPVTEAFGGLFSAIGDILESFGLFQEEGSGTSAVMDALLIPIKAVAAAITFTVEGLTFLIQGSKDFIDQSPFLTGVIENVKSAFSTLGTVISSIPAFFSGVVAAGKQAGTNIANFFRGIAIEAQILFQKIQQFNPFGPTQEAIDQAISDLNRQKAELQSESVGVFEAFGNAFNEALSAQSGLTEELPEAAEEAGKKIETELRKGIREGTKKGVEDAKKEIEKVAEAGSLQALSDIIGPIKKQFEELAVGSEAFNQKLKELIQVENDLAAAEEAVKLARETDEEIQTRISKELEETKAKNEALLTEARSAAEAVTDLSLAETTLRLSEQRNLKLQNDKLTDEERLQIEKDFQTELLRIQIEAEKERLSIQEEGSAEQIATKQRIIDAELQLIKNGLDAEEELRQEGIKKTEDAEAQKLALKEASIKAAFDVAKTFTNLAFDLAKQKAEEEKNIELEAVRLEFAEKLKLAAGNSEDEERLKAEQARKEREIDKKAAQQKKALAITQAVIAGALGALQTIAQLGFPLAIPALIAVAATTAANIAVISSRKIKKGVLAKVENKNFADGGLAPGRLHSDGGTPAIIGGQEAVEIEVGEAITNRRSTARFLQILSDINQSEGGVRFEGTQPLNRRRIDNLNAFEMLQNGNPTIAKRGLSPRLSPSVRRSFQAGGVSSVQSAAASIGQQVEFQGRILTDEDVRMIAKAAALGTKEGIEAANLFGRFKRQAEREISQNNRSQV